MHEQIHTLIKPAKSNGKVASKKAPPKKAAKKKARK